MAPNNKVPEHQWPLLRYIKDFNLWLAKRPLKTNGHSANLGLTSLVKEATGVKPQN